MPARQTGKARQIVMVDDEQESLPSAEEMAEALERMPAWQVDGSPDAPDPVQRGDDTAGSVEVPPSPAPPPSSEMTPSPPPLLRILEALLFVGGPPLTAQ